MALDIEFTKSYTFHKVQLYKRNTFDKIQAYLGDETIIVLIGARQVGKTHILYYIQKFLEKKGKKVFYYDLEYPELLNTLNGGVDSFTSDLSGKGYKKGQEVFVLIDEIQYLENPSSFLKIVADHHKNIHLIVSGSSTFDIKSKFKDSLVGRTTVFEIFPLTFKEFLTFRNSEYSDLQNLSEAGLKSIKLLYAEFIKYGAYPKVVLEDNVEKKKQYLLQMIDTYIRKDIRDLADIGDVNKFNNMLKVLASQSGQLLNTASLSREMGISVPTIQKYLNILEETFIIKRVVPFSRNRSVEISKNPKIFFVDSGLQSILWLNNFQEILLGSVFETNIFSELVKKYGRSNIRFWRTKIGQEIDFIVQKDDLTVLPMEAKTNFGQFSENAMKIFQKKYKVDKWNVVAFTGNKFANNYIYPWEA